MRHTAWLETALRRDGLIFVAGLLLVATAAWAWLLLGAGMDMSAVEMTAMAGMDGWLMRQVEWTPGYAALMFSMWWIMMIAMMIPSAAPMLLTVIQMTAKQSQGQSTAQRYPGSIRRAPTTTADSENGKQQRPHPDSNGDNKDHRQHWVNVCRNNSTVLKQRNNRKDIRSEPKPPGCRN